MEDQFNTNDYNNDYDVHRFMAVVKDVSTGETMSMPFQTGIPKEHSNDLEATLKIARVLIEYVLRDDNDEPLFTVESIERVQSVVDIIIDPICPN